MNHEEVLKDEVLESIKSGMAFLAWLLALIISSTFIGIFVLIGYVSQWVYSLFLKADENMCFKKEFKIVAKFKEATKSFRPE